MKFLVLPLLTILVSINSSYGYPSTTSNPQNLLAKSKNIFLRAGSTVDFPPELKPPTLMYQGAVLLGQKKSLLSPFKTVLLGIVSGCHIAFGAYLLLSVGANCPEIAKSNPGLQKILMGAFGLPFGLMMTLVGGGELFTGNTALVTTALLEKKTDVKGLMKNWFFSFLGNFIGSLSMAFLAYQSGTLGASPAAVNSALAKTSLAFGPAFIRGLLCNWLVCMAVYMASGASSLAGKMVAIFFPISSFVALGLEHSIANMFIIPLAILRGADISFSAFLLKNLLPVTLGNIVGGAFCVAGMYSMTYGSTLDARKSKLSAAVQLRGGAVLPTSKRTGTSYLPPAALEKAADGNMFEKVKLKKDGTEAWTDVHEYAAAIRSGKMNWEDVASDDMDIRLKYAGMFHRKKATPGKFMMRLRIPNGVVTSDQMRYYGEAVKPYGPEIGVVDITTRQNIQLRGMPLEGGADIILGLNKLNQTSFQSGLDNVRNMVGSPIAGIDPFELFDTRQLTRDLDNWYSNYGHGNAEYGNLPRKFNIAVSGSRDDFAHTMINDIGLQPVAHSSTGEMGFNVVLGGYMSIKRVAESIPMDAWVKPSEVVNLCKSILELFRDEGDRKDRQKARLMWLIEHMGLPAFKEAVEKRMSETDPSRNGAPLDTAQVHKEPWTQGHRELLGVHPQKQEGKSFVSIHVPVGRLSSEECSEIAALADKYSAGEVRLTVEQNIILPNVDNSKVDQLLAESALSHGKRLSVYPGSIVGGVVSCTGAQFCPLALVETKTNIDTISRKLQSLVEVPHPVRIHMTGCPNSCGQVQMADIGLMGAPAKKADETGAMKAVPGVNIFVGGKIGDNPFLAMEPEIKGIPLTEDDLIPVLQKLLVDKFGGKVR